MDDRDGASLSGSQPALFSATKIAGTLLGSDHELPGRFSHEISWGKNCHFFPKNQKRNLYHLELSNYLHVWGTLILKEQRIKSYASFVSATVIHT